MGMIMINCNDDDYDDYVDDLGDADCLPLPHRLQYSKVLMIN